MSDNNKDLGQIVGNEEMYINEGVVDVDVGFPSTTFDDAEKQEQEVMGGEIWEQDDDNLLDMNNSSMFYNDFPPLPDFPCMSSSSSSSSSSAPAPTNPVSASSSSSSASSTASWAVWKSDSDDRKGKKRYHHHDTPCAQAALSSTTASEDFLPGGGDIDPNVMENFRYMDLNLIDENDVWDPSSIFQNDNSMEGAQEQIGGMVPEDSNHQQKRQQEEQAEEDEESGGLYFLQGNSELSAIFLEWLKQNRDHISAHDMRSIKLKRSTIECASKRLGSSKEGKKQLLKLILEWVQHHQLQKKKSKEAVASLPSGQSPPTCHYQDQNPNPNSELNPNSNVNSVPLDPNSCFSTSSWMQALPPYTAATPAVYPAPGMGYVPDPCPNGMPISGSNPIVSGNSNYFAPSTEYPLIESPETWQGQQYPVSSQFNCFADNGNVAVGALNSPGLPGNSYTYQLLDGNGERLVKLGPSATKEARKKRMARHRRVVAHHHCQRHNNHQAQPQPQAQNHHIEQKARIAAESYSPSQATPWIYWSPSPAAPAPGPAAPLVAPFDGSRPRAYVVKQPQTQPENHQSRQDPPSRRDQGFKAEKNLQFLLQKVLKQSDVGNLGRIVLPKKEAEMHLPGLESRDGIPIAIEDIGTSNVFVMRYRFWPNNKSRMYLLENTGEFVRINGLQEGDFIVLYSDTKSGKYLIRGVKVRQPGAKVESKKPSKKSRSSPQATNNSTHAPPLKQPGN